MLTALADGRNNYQYQKLAACVKRYVTIVNYFCGEQTRTFCRRYILHSATIQVTMHSERLPISVSQLHRNIIKSLAQSAQLTRMT